MQNLTSFNIKVWFIIQPLHQTHHLQSTTGWTLVDLDPVRALKLLSGFDKVISSLNFPCPANDDDKRNRPTAQLDYNIAQNQSRQSQRIPNVSGLHLFVMYCPYLALFLSFLSLNTVGWVKQCTPGKERYTMFDVGSFIVFSRKRWIFVKKDSFFEGRSDMCK